MSSQPIRPSAGSKHPTDPSLMRIPPTLWGTDGFYRQAESMVEKDLVFGKGNDPCG